MLFVKAAPIAAKILIRFADVKQLLHNQLDHDDVVEIANDGNIVRENVFWICEINKHGQQAFAIRVRELPFLVRKHLQERFDFRDATSDTKSGRGARLRISSSTSRIASTISPSSACRTASRECCRASRKYFRSRSLSSNEILRLM